VVVLDTSHYTELPSELSLQGISHVSHKYFFWGRILLCLVP
jgi:hypothetical protein